MGKVWLDLNGDGDLDAGKPGLAGVTLALNLGTNQIGQAITLGSGLYSFMGLTAGLVYTVREVQPAWLRFSTTQNGRVPSRPSRAK